MTVTRQAFGKLLARNRPRVGASIEIAAHDAVDLGEWNSAAVRTANWQRDKFFGILTRSSFVEPDFPKVVLEGRMNAEIPHVLGAVVVELTPVGLNDNTGVL